MQLTKKRSILENNKVVYLPIDEIVPNPAQPRKNFDSAGLENLADSISRYGILQPLTVRRTGRGYELIAGERRLRAALMAGMKEVPCILFGIDNEQSSLFALIENLQRRDLDFIEEAEGLARLIRLYGLSQEEVAQKVGRSQPSVANKLRILKLSPPVITLLRENNLTERHARALLRFESEEDRLSALKKVVGEGLNVAETEDYIEKRLSLREKPKRKGKNKNLTYVIKDVRLFINTVTRGIDMMEKAGIDAQFSKSETEDGIEILIKIPKQTRV